MSTCWADTPRRTPRTAWRCRPDRPGWSSATSNDAPGAVGSGRHLSPSARTRYHRGMGALLRVVVAVVIGFTLLPGDARAEDRPLYYTRALTPADLEGRTLRELALMRNTIYARAGHQFRKKWLHDYFAAQSWYKPLAKDDNTKITKVDRANAALIAQAEEAPTQAELKKRRDDVLARQHAGKATA